MDKPLEEMKGDELFRLFGKYFIRDYFGYRNRHGLLGEIYEAMSTKNPSLGYYAVEQVIEEISGYEANVSRLLAPDNLGSPELKPEKCNKRIITGSSAGAGPGIHQFDEVQEKANLEEMLGIIQNRNIFICRVDGDSMINAGILNGALLFVERNPYPKPGEIIVATYDGELFVKRLFVAGGEVRLKSENPIYEDILVQEDMVFIIHGIVKGVFQIPT